MLFSLGCTIGYKLREQSSDLGHNFDPADEELCRCVLKLFCVHIATRAPRLSPGHGLSQLVRRDLGTGLQEAYGLRAGLHAGTSFTVSINTAARIAALGGLQGLLQGPQHSLAQRPGGGPLVWAAHLSVEPLSLPDVVREHSAREHAVVENVVRDGLVVLAVEAPEERGRGGGGDSPLAAQALQGLHVQPSSHSSSCSCSCSFWAVSAGAIGAFRGLPRTSAGPSEVQKVVGHTDIVAERRSGFNKTKWIKEGKQSVCLSVSSTKYFLIFAILTFKTFFLKK